MAATTNHKHSKKPPQLNETAFRCMLRKGTTNMDVKEITQKIIDTYKVAQPLYENHAPLYGSDVPICPPYKELYKFIVYIQDYKPEVFADILDFIIHRPLTISVLTTNYLVNFTSEDQKIPAATLLAMLTAIAEYRKYKFEKNNGSY